MSRFRFREIRLENYRCFGELTLPFEEDTTVIFAENGGGKTALLTALAMGLAVFQPGVPRTLKLDARRDIRAGTLDEKGRRKPAGACKVAWTAAVGESESVTWSTAANPASGRAGNRLQALFDALERMRTPGERWPLFAWYGVDRLGRLRGRRRKVERTADRWEAYASALDPNLDEAPLLQWLKDETVGDMVRRQYDEPERFFHTAVMEATVRATPGVTHAWYDPAEGPVVRFEDGHAAPWSELSDGYHVFIALVADVARRAVMLNEFDGAEAPKHVEGVVLIDELDLHLHPRWQRVALPSLRKVFPNLQLVVTTHSPQVLSSVVENRQVRRLIDGKLQEHPVFVEGRDTNAILREHMRTDERDDKGVADLNRLHHAIDRGDRVEAERIHRELAKRWGDNDPALIRAGWFMEDEE